MRSLIMSDVETGTEWSHLLGRGMAGKLKGRELTALVCDMVTWDAWKREHPNTTALDMSRTSQNYSRDFYKNPNRFVFGFESNGSAWMLGLDELQTSSIHEFTIDDEPLLVTFDKEGVVARLFNRRINGQTFDFEVADDRTIKDKQTDSTWDVFSGEAIDGMMKGKQLEPRVGIMSYRRAWENFHPKSKDVRF